MLTQAGNVCKVLKLVMIQLGNNIMLLLLRSNDLFSVKLILPLQRKLCNIAERVAHWNNVSTLYWKVSSVSPTDAFDWASGPNLLGKLLVIFGSIKIKSEVINIR